MSAVAARDEALRGQLSFSFKGGGAAARPGEPLGGGGPAGAPDRRAARAQEGMLARLRLGERARAVPGGDALLDALDAGSVHVGRFWRAATVPETRRGAQLSAAASSLIAVLMLGLWISPDGLAIVVVNAGGRIFLFLLCMALVVASCFAGVAVAARWRLLWSPGEPLDATPCVPDPSSPIKLRVRPLLAAFLTMHALVLAGVLWLGVGFLTSGYVVTHSQVRCDELTASGACSGASFAWSGGVSASGATLRYKTGAADCAAGMRLLLDDGATEVACVEGGAAAPDADTPTCSCWETAVSGRGSAFAANVTGLPACAAVAFEALGASGGVAHRGSFTTFPAGDAPCTSQGFRIGFSSCAVTGSDAPVWDAMGDADLDLFVHMGDLHYDNVDSAAVGDYADAFERVLDSDCCSSSSEGRQPRFYRDTPLAYMWDDHDFLGSNAGGESSHAAVARAAYRAYVPHYEVPLADGCAAEADDESLYQRIDVGGLARILVTDTRSSQHTHYTMMGTCQTQRFIADLTDPGAPKVLIWVSTSPWLYRKDSKEGTWAYHDDYPEWEAQFRDAINAVEASGRFFTVLSGDMHSLAWDLGSHTTVDMGGIPGFPLFQVSPLDKPGFGESCKGGDYDGADMCNGITNQLRLWGLGGRFGVLTLHSDGFAVGLFNRDGTNLAFAHDFPTDRGTDGYYRAPAAGEPADRERNAKKWLLLVKTFDNVVWYALTALGAGLWLCHMLWQHYYGSSSGSGPGRPASVAMGPDGIEMSAAGRGLGQTSDHVVVDNPVAGSHLSVTRRATPPL